MNGLNLLKQRLLGSSNNEQDVVNSLCMIMEICGGYKQLQEMPMSSIDPILKYLKFRQEQENKRFGTKK